MEVFYLPHPNPLNELVSMKNDEKKIKTENFGIGDSPGEKMVHLEKI